MNPGDKVRIKSRRGAWNRRGVWTLRSPIIRRGSGDIAGWWTVSPEGDLHAFPLKFIRPAKIKKERTT